MSRAPDPGAPLDKSDRLVKKDSKSSLKTTFRSVQVYRLPQTVTAAMNSVSSSQTQTQELLSMTVTTKEKKQKSKFWGMVKRGRVIA